MRRLVDKWLMGILSPMLMMVIGCGAPPIEDYRVFDDLVPVKGQVTFKGKPIQDAAIRFHPAGKSTVGGVPPRVAAVSDAEGRFELFTFRPEGKGQGAPIGDYRVTVSWVGPTAGLPQEKLDSLKELIPAKYINPRTSPIEVQIAAGQSEIPAVSIP